MMCHTRSRRHRTREQPPDPFDAPSRAREAAPFDAPSPTRETAPLDAPSPGRETGPVRASDAERERVAILLRDHAAAGRLDPDELGERLERAYGARYSADLDAVLTDLPLEPAPRRARERSHGGPSAPDLAAVPIAIGALIALAAITGSWWLMWLIWPVVIVLGPRRHYRRSRI